ncbi:hypothetical protein [Streptomyces sp. NPDC002825]|uniref:hypothetical protein n=1 Tax=Streptomyces sp. NPDC002825 TaxID=3154666 RepID=UPI003327BC91
MTSPTLIPQESRLTGTAPVSVVRGDLAEVERRGPLKFADPAAWLVRSALAEAAQALPAAPGETAGIIGVSEFATGQSLRAVAADAVEGHSSPRRFVAASPGTLVGLSSIEFGHVGPTLLLTMPEEPGWALAHTIAESWLTGEVPSTTWVAIVSYTVEASGAHRATCRWVSAPSPAGEVASP